VALVRLILGLLGFQEVSTCFGFFDFRLNTTLGSLLNAAFLFIYSVTVVSSAAGGFGFLSAAGDPGSGKSMERNRWPLPVSSGEKADRLGVSSSRNRCDSGGPHPAGPGCGQSPQ
jgi:hypothetical protein